MSQANKERFTQSVQSALVEVTNKLARENDLAFLQSDVNKYVPIQYSQLQEVRDSMSQIRNMQTSQERQVLNQDPFFNTSVFQFEIDFFFKT